MVYRRTYRRRNVRRRRRKYPRRYRIHRNPRSKLFFYKRSADFGVVRINPPTTGPQFGRGVFSLNDLPNFTDFTNLYDNFRINAVKITFIPAANVSLVDSTTNQPTSYYNTRFFTAIDNNSATLPTSINQIREYDNCKWTPLNKIHQRYFYVYPPPNSNGVSDQGSRKRMWINTENNATNYFGIIWGLEALFPLQPDQTVMYTIEVKYYMVFKNPK